MAASIVQIERNLDSYTTAATLTVSFLSVSLQWPPWWAPTFPWTQIWVHWVPLMPCSRSYPWCPPLTAHPHRRTPWTAASPGTCLFRFTKSAVRHAVFPHPVQTCQWSFSFSHFSVNTPDFDTNQNKNFFIMNTQNTWILKVKGPTNSETKVA